MSEEPNENGLQPENKPTGGSEEKTVVPAASPASPVNASPDTAAKAPAAAAKAEAPKEPEPIAAGPVGKRLDDAKLAVTHLGNDASGKECVRVEVSNLIAVAEFLKGQCGFDLMLSCTGIDWKDRLESVYHLFSTSTLNYLILKVDAVDEHSPSLTPTWNAADWHERESYDLLGIIYDGHPNLTRILMPDDWLGHPLRKDYKVNDPRLVWNER